MRTPDKDTVSRLRRYRRMAGRAVTWMCPFVIELLYGAALMSACQLPPMNLLREAGSEGAVPEPGTPPIAAHLTAGRPVALSAAELGAWEQLVREFSGGTTENSRGPEW
jgi:hypothetical protein